MTEIETQQRPPRQWLSSWSSAAVGLVAGGIAGVWSAMSSGTDIFSSSLLVAASVVLILHRARRNSLGATQFHLGAWWLAVFVGITAGLRDATSDAAWFVALAWLGTSVFATVLPDLRRRADRDIASVSD